jgi:hypothetical protein
MSFRVNIYHSSSSKQRKLGDEPITAVFSGVQAFGENVMVCWLALLLARIAEVEAGPA